jgi:AraC-like DNA-binding protein
MLRYAIQYEQVSRILHMLTSVLGVRIVIYDAEDRKLDALELQGDAAYCRTRRRAPEFEERCVACDRQHLRMARDGRRAHVYECHDGLAEGVVPLFDEAGDYLGAFQVGPIRLGERPRARPLGSALRRLYDQLPLYDRPRMEGIASLLEYLGEYVHQNHLIRLRGVPWIDRLKDHIEENLAAPLTIADLSRAVGVSPSQVSHGFRKEVGLPVRQYVIERRMAAARTLLEKGRPVREVALALGYCDEFHFSKSFKARVRVSPSRYRPA